MVVALAQTVLRWIVVRCAADDDGDDCNGDGDCDEVTMTMMTAMMMMTHWSNKGSFACERNAQANVILQ